MTDDEKIASLSAQQRHLQKQIKLVEGMDLKPIPVSKTQPMAEITLERLCAIEAKLGYLEGVLIGLRYRVDDATRVLIDDVLKKWEGK